VDHTDSGILECASDANIDTTAEKKKSMLVSFSIGILVTGLVLCFTVKPFGQAGAAMGMLAGEASVLVAHAYFCGRKAILTIFARKRLFHYLAGGALRGLVAYCISQLSGVMLIARLHLSHCYKCVFLFYISSRSQG